MFISQNAGIIDVCSYKNTQVKNYKQIQCGDCNRCETVCGEKKNGILGDQTREEKYPSFIVSQVKINSRWTVDTDVRVDQ